MKKTLLLLSILGVLMVVFGVHPVSAATESSAIGVSPAKVVVNNLLPGSKATVEIVISRSDVSGEQTFLFEPVASESSGWLLFPNGKEVTFAANENRVTAKIAVQIPQGTAYKKYTTTMKIMPKDDSVVGQIKVQTSIMMQFEFVVTDKQVESYKIVSGSIASYTVSDSPSVLLKIQNEGNVSSKPGKIVLEVKDQQGYVVAILQQTDIGMVEPLDTVERQVALTGNPLPVGQYLAKLSVYDANGNVIYTADLSFSVLGKNTKNEGVLQRTLSQNMIYILFGFSVLLVIAAIVVLAKLKKPKDT